MYVCMCIYIYIYIYTHTHTSPIPFGEAGRADAAAPPQGSQLRLGIRWLSTTTTTTNNNNNDRIEPAAPGHPLALGAKYAQSAY